jgi:hypothetical protein
MDDPKDERLRAEGKIEKVKSSINCKRVGASRQNRKNVSFENLSGKKSFAKRFFVAKHFLIRRKKVFGKPEIATMGNALVRKTS